MSCSGPCRPTGDLAAADEAVCDLGLCVGPDDMYLGLRGLRTMGVRLAQHLAAGLRSRAGSPARPEVARVLHPALESDPGHAIWRRDYSGACGLFSIVLQAGAASGRACLSQRADPVRHRRFLGRFRKPRDPVRLQHHAVGNPMGAGRTDRAVSYRARGRGRPDRAISSAALRHSRPHPDLDFVASALAGACSADLRAARCRWQPTWRFARHARPGQGRAAWGA